MSLISKPYTFSVGAVIVAAEHNSNFDTIYNAFNGNISNVNIVSGAGITDDKLSQITTAGKVSGAAITLLTSLVSGAGKVPTANLGTGTANATTFLRGDQSYVACPRIKVGTFTRDVSTASGSQAVTGVGFTPKVLLFLGAIDNSVQNSIGVDDGTSRGNLFSIDNEIASRFLINTSSSITMRSSGATLNTAVVASLDSDGFTLTWTKTGSPTGTATLVYLAIG